MGDDRVATSRTTRPNAPRRKSAAKPRKRIAVVTGTRAEYGLLQSTLTALAGNPRIELQIVATGMHLLPRFGETVRQIEADGFRVAARVPMQRGDDSPVDQALGLGRGVVGIARFLVAAKSQRVVVLGDRIEALAGALAATTVGVPVAQIHGGDVAPGDFDGPMRDAITQFSDLHLTATKTATKRVISLGADQRRVCCVGAPGIDRIAELLKQFKAPPPAERRDAIVIQHAYGRSVATERQVAHTILDCVRDAGLRPVIIAPNSDRGNRGVRAAIELHARRDPAELHTSLPRDEFLRRLIGARLLIGNSSTAYIEAPFAGVPSIDVGSRQVGREPGGTSLIRVAESKSAIRAAIRQALQLRLTAGRRTVYGDGRAGQRIAARLANDG